MKRALAGLAIGLVLTCWPMGCTLLTPSRAELPTLHALMWAAPARPTVPSPDAPTLLVSVPRAGPGFDSPRMAYSSAPQTLAYFARHQWVETPARMLAPLLVRAAEHGGRFGAVVQAPSSVAATVRLDTEVVELVQDFSVTPSRVRLELRVQLVDTDARRVVAVRDLVLAEPAPSDDPEGGVVAANRVLDGALHKIAELCASTPDRH